MTNARPTEVKASALDQRRYSTASAPRPDIAQAVKDIRAACAVIAQLADLDAMRKKEVQQ